MAPSPISHLERLEQGTLDARSPTPVGPSLRTLFGVAHEAVWDDGALVGIQQRPWKVLQHRVGFDEQGRPLWVNVPAVVVDNISDPPTEGVPYL